MAEIDKTVGDELVSALKRILVRDVSASRRENLEISSEAKQAISILEVLGEVPMSVSNPYGYAKLVKESIIRGFERPGIRH